MPGATTLTPPGNRETVLEQAAAPTHNRPAGHLTVVFVRHNCLWLRCRPPSSALTCALLAGCVQLRRLVSQRRLSFRPKLRSDASLTRIISFLSDLN